VDVKYEDKFDKWTFRSNARRKITFGVEEATFKHKPGQSNRSHVSVNMAKAMARENLEVLKLMRTEKYLKHIKTMRDEAFKFYLKIK
jgi:hypothetical protein